MPRRTTERPPADLASLPPVERFDGNRGIYLPGTNDGNINNFNPNITANPQIKPEIHVNVGGGSSSEAPATAPVNPTRPNTTGNEAEPTINETTDIGETAVGGAGVEDNNENPKSNPEIDALNAKLDKLIEDNAALREQLNGLNAKIDQLAQENARLNEEVARLTKENEDLRNGVKAEKEKGCEIYTEDDAIDPQNIYKLQAKIHDEFTTHLAGLKPEDMTEENVKHLRELVKQKNIADYISGIEGLDEQQMAAILETVYNVLGAKPEHLKRYRLDREGDEPVTTDPVEPVNPPKKRRGGLLRGMRATKGAVNNIIVNIYGYGVGPIDPGTGQPTIPAVKEPVAPAGAVATKETKEKKNRMAIAGVILGAIAIPLAVAGIFLPHDSDKKDQTPKTTPGPKVVKVEKQRDQLVGYDGHGRSRVEVPQTAKWGTNSHGQKTLSFNGHTFRFTEKASGAPSDDTLKAMDKAGIGHGLDVNTKTLANPHGSTPAPHERYIPEVEG